MVPILEVQHLSKQFSDSKAVDDISFTVNQGDVYGFLGQNGAGKSTTLRMILGLIRQDTGTIEFDGRVSPAYPKELLRQTGAVIERPDLYKYLTAYENLSMFARLSGVPVKKSRIMEQLETAGIAQRAHSKVKTFSQGMKQRLGIAIALVHDPKLIILDEPTNGLDPQGIADMRTMITRLSREMGKTVIVSSHLLNEIEMIASRMIIIHRGRKIIEGNVDELLDPAHTLVEVSTTNDTAAAEKIGKSKWTSQLVGDAPLKFRLHKNDQARLTADLVEMGIGITAIRPRHSLEDYFLNLTNTETHAAAASN